MPSLILLCFPFPMLSPYHVSAERMNPQTSRLRSVLWFDILWEKTFFKNAFCANKWVPSSIFLISTASDVWSDISGGGDRPLSCYVLSTSWYTVLVTVNTKLEQNLFPVLSISSFSYSLDYPWGRTYSFVFTASGPFWTTQYSILLLKTFDICSKVRLARPAPFFSNRRWKRQENERIKHSSHVSIWYRSSRRNHIYSNFAVNDYAWTCPLFK